MTPYQVDRYGVKYTTDPTLRRISGYYYPDPSRKGPSVKYDAPVISEIYPWLWVGGVEEDLTLPWFFKDVISLHTSIEYNITHQLDSHLVIHRIEDSPNQDLSFAESAAQWAIEREGPILVHCHMGLNRSNVVVAAMLCELGVDPDSAISLLREKRSPASLSNSHFEKWVREHYQKEEVDNR